MTNRPHSVRVRLQNEVGTKDTFRGTNFLTKNAKKFSPKCLNLYLVDQKASRKIPAKFPSQNQKKITDKLLQERRENILPKNKFGESLRGNRIGATGLRASERKSASERVSERVSEREGFQRFLRGFERFLEVFRGFERFSEIFERFSEFFERFSEVLSETLSEADFLSEALNPVAPNRVAP